MSCGKIKSIFNTLPELIKGPGFYLEVCEDASIINIYGNRTRATCRLW
jgi:hypothetical protein